MQVVNVFVLPFARAMLMAEEARKWIVRYRAARHQHRERSR